MWWRKKRKSSRAQERIQDGLFKDIGNLQKWWAFQMQYYELRWTLRQKKIGCIVFCVLSAAASMAILVNALFN